MYFTVLGNWVNWCGARTRACRVDTRVDAFLVSDENFGDPENNLNT